MIRYLEVYTKKSVEIVKGCFIILSMKLIQVDNCFKGRFFDFSSDDQ